MKTRYNLPETDPRGFSELLKLDSYCSTFESLKPFLHLIKIRASQLNQCAYCINMHTHEAIKGGETPMRIVLLNAWKDASIFTDKEKIVLEITESVTLISELGFADALYEKALAYFSDKEIAQISITIGIINLW